MNKFILALIVILVAITQVFSQTPETFKYQAIIRDGAGTVLSNQMVGFQLSILQSSETGNSVYTEIFTKTTNSFGLVNLDAGDGAVVSGNFSIIDWGTNSHFLKIELDESGGTSYSHLGTSKLNSVPYALHAKTAENTFSGNYNSLSNKPALLGDVSGEIDNNTVAKIQGNNVSINTPSSGQVLKWNGTEWAPADDNTTGGSGVDGVVDGASFSGTADKTLTLSRSNGLTALTANFTDEVDDLDANPSNELQTISKLGNVVTLSNSGGSFTDEIDDADHDIYNELQVLNFSNDTLYLTDGGQVYIGEYGNLWTAHGNDIFNANTRNVGVGLEDPMGKFVVQGDTAVSDTLPLFEVKNKDGVTVFAVYDGGVRVYVNDDPAKANNNKSGFAVGGYRLDKSVTNEYLRVTPDSVRIWIKEEETNKANNNKGGFAIGGYRLDKTTPDNYMNIYAADTAYVIDTSEARMVWYPIKEAFLTGRVLIEDADSVGYNSWATGFETKSIGNYSQALGYRARAFGNNSTAIGNYANAITDNSYAIGDSAVASGIGSFALGSIGRDDSGNPTGLSTLADGEYAMAIGMGAQSSGLSSLSAGSNCLASGDYSSAFGREAIASGDYSFAAGYHAEATANYAYALGGSALAEGFGSNAIGSNAKAHSLSSIALGRSADATGDYSMAFGFSSETSANYATSIGYNATASGLYSSAMGRDAIAIGESSFAFGYEANAGSTNSFALGRSSNASGSYSYAMGYSATASGSMSFAFGASTATGPYSYAFGVLANTSGNYSTAMGYSSEATGESAFAFGHHAEAFDDYAYALGYSANASANSAFAFGYESDAGGLNSFALGREANASASGSYAIGYGAIASDIYAIAIGRNAQATNDYAFAAGYGAVASNTYAVAIGKGAIANGHDGVAIGQTSKSSWDGVAIGHNTEAAAFSTAIGLGAEATGLNCFAVNGGTATGGYSKAIGYITASGMYSFAIGLNDQSATDVTQDNTMAIMGGKVGVGIKSPNATLDVVSASSDQALRVRVSGSTRFCVNSDESIIVGANLSSGPARGLYVHGRLGLGDSTPEYRVDLPNSNTNDGKGAAYAWLTYSDMRVKTNAREIPYGVSTIMQIKPLMYKHHSSTFENSMLDIDKNSFEETVGMFAQDLYKIVPSAVNKPKDENSEYWTVDYIKLIPVLIKAVQEQQKEIEELKSRNSTSNNTTQQELINELLKRIEKLEENK